MEELGIRTTFLPHVLHRLSQERIEGQVVPKRKYTKRKKYTVYRDKDGIACRNVREKWRKVFKTYGFRSLKDAMWKLRVRGYRIEDMAKLFGVTLSTFKARVRLAGIVKKGKRCENVI